MYDDRASLQASLVSRQGLGEYGVPVAAATSRRLWISQRYCLTLIAIIIFSWLIANSVINAGLRSEISSLKNSVSSNVESIEMQIASAACGLGAANIAVGTPVSVSPVDNGIIGGAGITAYLTSRQIVMDGAAPVKLWTLLTAQSSVLLFYTTGSLFNGTAASFVTLIPAVPDWLVGDTIHVNSGSVHLPVALDDCAVLGSNAPSLTTFACVGQGQAFVAVVDETSNILYISPTVPYAVGFNTGATITALNSNNAILTFFCTVGTDLFGMCAQTATVVGSSQPTLQLGASAVFAPDHESLAVTRLSDTSFLIGFPMDNATIATDDDEQVGFPLGVVIGVIQPDQSIVVYGEHGAAQPPLPWILYSAVKAHYFLDIVTVSANPGPDASAIVAIALSDSSAGNAVTLVTAVAQLFDDGTPSFRWGDVKAVTAAGVDATYNNLKISASCLTADACQVAIVVGDGLTSGAPAMAVAFVSQIDASISVLSGQLLLSPPLSITDDPSIRATSAVQLDMYRQLVFVLGTANIINVTLVEALAPTAGISMSVADACNAQQTVQVAVRGIVNAGVDGVTAKPIYATSRGQLVASPFFSYQSAAGKTFAAVLHAGSSEAGIASGDGKIIIHSQLY